MPSWQQSYFLSLFHAKSGADHQTNFTITSLKCALPIQCIYILHSNYQHQLCIPWVARLCLTVVSCWKCLYTLITPQAFTCARTRKESISCRSTASAKIIIIIIIVIIKIIKIIIIIIITVLDLLSFQGKVQKKNAGKTCTNEWTC